MQIFEFSILSAQMRGYTPSCVYVEIFFLNKDTQLSAYSRKKRMILAQQNGGLSEVYVVLLPSFVWARHTVFLSFG